MITYFDTSVLLKLVVEDEDGIEQAEQLWISADVAISAEIAYAEGRAALASARRARRLSAGDLGDARQAFEDLWSQLETVSMTADLIHRAGDLAEADSLRGYDAVHLAAALRVNAHVMASSDERLCAAAARHRLNVANLLG